MEQRYYREVDGEILPPDDAVFEELPEEPVDYDDLYAQYAPEVKWPIILEAGWSVNLEERRQALLALAAMYAAAAGSNGLEEYYDTPRGKEKIVKRYPGRADRVVVGNKKKKRYTTSEELRTAAPAIGVDGEDWVNLKLSAKDDLLARSCLFDLRQKIGVNVGYKQRNALMKRYKD